MWSHYASQHQGFCVQYAVNELDDLQREHLYPVVYSESRFSFASAIESGDTPDERMCAIILTAIHKAPDWHYEQEWRLVDVDTTGDHLEMPMPSPVGIYMGAKISSEHEYRLLRTRDRLNRECATNVPLYIMRLSESGYDMEPHRVDE